MLIELRASRFDPYAELCRYQSEALNRSGQFGATCVFVGTMRDFNEGETVRAMWLEHYPGMTEGELGKIVAAAAARWHFLDALVLHRVGEIFPEDTIVLVAVWSSHRGAAFDACREIMEALKQRAPFWKRERLEHGERWVERNTDGYC